MATGLDYDGLTDFCRTEQTVMGMAAEAYIDAGNFGQQFHVLWKSEMRYQYNEAGIFLSAQCMDDRREFLFSIGK